MANSGLKRKSYFYGSCVKFLGWQVTKSDFERQYVVNLNLLFFAKEYIPNIKRYALGNDVFYNRDNVESMSLEHGDIQWANSLIIDVPIPQKCS